MITWPNARQAEASIVVRSPGEPLVADHESFVLAEIVSPFGLAIDRGLDLMRLLRADPVAGAGELDKLTNEVKAGILDVIERKADGILYRLHGACEKWSTPMQYGGFLLERDREMLETARPLAFNVLFVVGDSDVYFDSVSDLPADAFGWDAQTTGVTADQMKSLRDGLLLAADSKADLWLDNKAASIAKALEKPKAHV